MSSLSGNTAQGNVLENTRQAGLATLYVHGFLEANLVAGDTEVLFRIVYKTVLERLIRGIKEDRNKGKGTLLLDKIRGSSIVLGTAVLESSFL